MAKMWMVLLHDEHTFEAPIEVRRREVDLRDVMKLHRNKPTEVFSTEEAARNFAANLAMKHPTVPVFIFESVSVMETQKPKVQLKKFNDRGELLPDA